MPLAGKAVALCSYLCIGIRVEYSEFKCMMVPGDDSVRMSAPSTFIVCETHGWDPWHTQMSTCRRLSASMLALLITFALLITGTSLGVLAMPCSGRLGGAGASTVVDVYVTEAAHSFPL